MLPTGGGPVFNGDWNCCFWAVERHYRRSEMADAPQQCRQLVPITCSVNGKQYVAVAVGSGSSFSKALATLTPEIPNPDGGAALWLFVLPS